MKPNASVAPAYSSLSRCMSWFTRSFADQLPVFGFVIGRAID